MVEEVVSITPYWQRLPYFFLYPFRWPAVFIIIAYGLCVQALSQPGVISMLALLVVSLIVLKYAYAVLNWTARGAAQPPPLSREVIVAAYEIPLKQGLILLVVAQAAGAIKLHFGHSLAELFIYVFGLLLPANIMLLGSTNSLLNALNPVMLVGLALRLSWSYVGVCALIIIFYFIWSAVSNWLLQQIPTPAIRFLSDWISAYFLLVAFHAMGYVIYQHHEDIGINTGMLADEQEQDDLQLPHLDLFNRFIDQENYAAAADELKYHIQHDPENSNMHLKLHQVLQLGQDTQQLCLHGRQLISLLLAQEKNQHAIQVYRNCKTANSEFVPLEDDYQELAEMLRIAHRYEEAIALLESFPKHYPDSEELPDILLLMAQIWLLDLQRIEPAREILNRLATQFPDHPVQFQVQKMRELLQRLAV